ncbi:YARHG domain-containing protein [Leptotrichia trevisanii]
MKKLGVAILMLAFIVSCGNKKDETGNGKNSATASTVKQEKIQNPQGATVALNQADFKIENDFIYYQGNIFTGKVTFDNNVKSGYIYVSNGKIEGEAEINYKLSGMKRNEVYKQGNLISFSVTENGITTEIGLTADSNSNSYMSKKTPATVSTKYGKNSYFINLENATGRMEINGKIFDNLNADVEEENVQSISSIISENGGNYNVKYIYDIAQGKIVEKKYRMDSKNDKSEVLSEIRELADTNMEFSSGMRMFGELLDASVAASQMPQNAAVTPQPVPAPVNTATQPQPAPAGQDDDLELLDRVYDEVMHKNNTAILNTFSKEKIGYIRNTMFAKKGYKFKNPKYASYFSQKSWYRGIYDNDEILSPEEKRFVLILKEKE